MEFLLPVLAILGILGAGPEQVPTRQARLYVVLERAEMLHEAARGHGVLADDGSESDRELALDLMYMELTTGYLAKTCICDDGSVTRMRLMIAHVTLLRLLGHSDETIEERLVAAAGEDGARLRQFLGFAGLDGINHFICADFMSEALAMGMQASELREHIDAMTPEPAPESAVASL